MKIFFPIYWTRAQAIEWLKERDMICGDFQVSFNYSRPVWTKLALCACLLATAAGAAPLGGKAQPTTLAWTPPPGYKTFEMTWGQAGSSNMTSVAITGTNWTTSLRPGTAYHFSLVTVNRTNGLQSLPVTLNVTVHNSVNIGKASDLMQ